MQAQKSFADKMSAIESYTEKFNTQLARLAQSLSEQFSHDSGFINQNAAFLYGGINNLIIRDKLEKRDNYVGFMPAPFAKNEVLNVHFNGLSDAKFEAIKQELAPMAGCDQINDTKQTISISLSSERTVLRAIEVLSQNNVQLNQLLAQPEAAL